MNKTLNNLVFLSKGDDWFWDNDENGMTYFIYDRVHNLHDVSAEKRYQIIMTPQSEIGTILKINVIPEASTCVLESDDSSCMESWANNMSDGVFPACPVPDYINQYEAVKQFVRAVSSTHMTESDTTYLYRKALNSYHITESDMNDYMVWQLIEESEDKPVNADNTEKFIEGVGNIAANVGAGGAGAIIMQLVKNLPGPIQAIAGVGTAIASGVAKYFGTAAAIKRSDEYKDLVAKGDAKEAAKLVTSKAIKSAAQAVASAGAGALASKFLPGLINKIAGKTAIKADPTELESAATTAVKTDIDKAMGNGMPTDVADKIKNGVNTPDASKLEGELNPSKGVLPDVKTEVVPKVELPSIDKMNAEQLGKIGPEEYKKFLADNPKDGIQTLLKNPAIANNPNELAELYKSGAFNNMSYGQMGQLRTAIKANGGDPTQFQGMLNAMVSPDLKGAKQFADLGVSQNVNMMKAAGGDSFLTNQYVSSDTTSVLNNAANHGFDTNQIRTQVGQDNFYKSMGMGSNANGTYNVTNNMANGVTGTFDPSTNTLNYTNASNGLTGQFDVNGNVATTAKGLKRIVGTDGTISYVDAHGKPVDPTKGVQQYNKQNSIAARNIARQAAKATPQNNS